MANILKPVQGTQWVHKDLKAVYTITGLTYDPHLVNKNREDLVWYEDKKGNTYVRTCSHFVKSFIPVEVAPYLECVHGYNYAIGCDTCCEGIAFANRLLSYDAIPVSKISIDVESKTIHLEKAPICISHSLSDNKLLRKAELNNVVSCMEF